MKKVSIRIEYILAVIIAGVLTVFLLADSERIDSAFYPGLLPLGIFIFQTIRRKMDVIQLISKTTLSDKIISICFAIIFMAFIPVMDLWTNTAWGKNIIEQIIILAYCILIFISLFIINLQYVTMELSFNALDKETQGGYFRNFKYYKSYFFLICLMAIAYIVSCYPGLLHGDGWNIWMIAETDRGWSDWHPVSYIFLIRCLLKIWNNPFIMVCFQTVVFLYIELFVLNHLYNYIGVISCKVYTIASYVNIMIFFFLHTVTKDTPFSVFLLGFCITLLAMLHGEKNKFLYIQLITFGIMASSMRHMMIVPISGGFIFAIVYWALKRHKKETAQFLFMLCIVIWGVIGSRTLIIRYFDVEPNRGYVKYSVPLQMMAAYAATGGVDEKSREYMEQYMPLENWAKEYGKDPYLSDNISRGTDLAKEKILCDIEKESKSIYIINWRFLTHNFAGYWEAFFKQNSELWRMSDNREHVVCTSPYFINVEKCVEENRGEWNPHRNYLTEIMESLTVFAAENKIWNIFSYHAGIYVYFILFGVALAIYKKKYEILIGFIPYIILGLLLSVSIPQQAIRYVLPMFHAGILAFSICFRFYDR